MALIDKLTAIANAIRSKTKKTGTLTLDEMVTEINNISGDEPTYDTPSISVSTSGLITASANGKSNTSQLTTQAGKTVTPSESEQTAVASQRFSTGAVKVGAISSTYVGAGVTRQATKSVTPNDTTQTVLSSGVYTTGDIKVNAVPTETKSAITPTKASQTINATSGKYLKTLTVNAIPDSYIIPSGSETKTANGTYDVTSLAQLIVNVAGGGLPSGFSAIATGTYTFDSDMTGNSGTSSAYQKTVTHNLGVIPDLIIFYAPNNVAQTYSHLAMIYGNTFMNWRGSTYKTNVFYHSNSTTTVSGTSCTTTYGIKNVTTSTFDIKTYSNSASYFWRAGTYNWIAIKFS